MSRAATVSIETPRFTIQGSSRAGVESWYRVKELGVALDIGRCPDNLIGVSKIVLTHAHIDHAAGLPYYASQRKLQRLDPGTVFVPAASLGGFRELIAAHERLENTTYAINLVGIAPGEEIELRRDLVLRAHAASHPIPANAYEFIERRSRLRAELRGLAPTEIERRRASGEEVSEPTEASILFYTGDTDRQIFESCDEIFRSEVLLIECSFTWDDDRERAKRYSHIHIDDIAGVADRFRNKLIVLTHFSLRDAREEIEREVRSKLPASLMERVHFVL
ncbi:MAG: MBL fold metallo-hydrolase [Acidobacteria bacterium]|nr:MBL fold metallo-hydrolase [Acidobacteriota bacterium]